MKQALVKGGVALLRTYYRHMPLAFGKRRVWHSVVRRLVAQGRGLDMEAETRFGARMHVRFPDTIQSFVYFFGVWEPAITAYLARTLTPGDIAIDVGANIGYDTLLAAHLVGEAGHVHAIEASPHVFALLTRNLALNRVANVTAHPFAVCAETIDVPIYLHDPSNLGGTTIVPEVAARRGALLEAMVAGRPLPSIVGEAAIRAARLIKIDVEGAEWPAVQGFAHLLPSLSPRTEVLVEVSAEGLRDHGASIQDFLGLFRAAGFTPFSIGNPYSVDTYLASRLAVPERLTGEDFDQLDILFRREN